MFMVEANEAVARSLDRRNMAFLRRIHPSPDQAANTQLASFIKVCGHKLPKSFSRQEVPQVLEGVKGRPESHAVNLAVLKSFRTAEYSPIRVGHYALASDQYCHFTSPIRRYADLTVHRLMEDVVRERTPSGADMSALVKLGDSLSMSERRAEAAERELITVLVLQLLETKVGEIFDGVVTGVTNFGLFAELPRYGIDGLIRMEDLGDDWWEIFPKSGEIRGERSGRKYRIGDALAVQIVSVNVPARQLNLVLPGQESRRKAGGKKGQKKSGKASPPPPRAKRRRRPR
jgi:ribonuclease R